MQCLLNSPKPSHSHYPNSFKSTMRKFYLHKLQHQEMGSTGADGKPNRGRYLYLSKDSGDFFPHLSSVALNDTILLPVIAPNSSNRVYVKFVYHNDKFA